MKKRVTIPLGEVKENLVLHSLKTMHNMLNGLGLDKSEEVYYAIHDLKGLMGIFSGEFKVTIEIEEKELETFASKFGVDFPPFVSTEIVDIKENKEEDEEQVFEHLAYEEDGGLVLAIRSNKPFEHSTCEDDSDMPHYRYERVEEGENLFMLGYSAVSYFEGWMILKDGDVLERVLI